MSDLTPAEQAEAWNAAHPVGTRVRYRPVLGQDAVEIAETRSPAFAIPSGTALVTITGRTGGVSLSHLEVVGEDVPLDPEPVVELPLTPTELAAATAIENELCAAERLFNEEIDMLARVAVAAACPLIEAEVRAKVAAAAMDESELTDETWREICRRADWDPIYIGHIATKAVTAAYHVGRADAARIARGDHRDE